MFLYNGKYGVVGDDNGLYYMRARYYDISIKRFVNQDVVIGHLDATSSLNRYAYCEGNPVSYLDPFGLDRWDTDEMHLAAGALAALAGKISIRCPVVGACISAFANGFDIGLTINDMVTDALNGKKKNNFKNVMTITLDLIGIITAGISNSYFEQAEFVAKIEGRMTGYENYLSVKFDKWKNIDDKVGKVSFQVWFGHTGPMSRFSTN